MEKMNMLNDEELEKVVGGVSRISITVVDGKIKIGDPSTSKCQNAYFLDKYVGTTVSLGGTCEACVYYQNGYCINQDFLIDMENSRYATVHYK